MLNFFKKIALFASAALILSPVFANPLDATPTEIEANPASQIEQASPPIMELAAADEVSSAPATTTEATAEKTEKTAKKQHHRHHRKAKKEETKSESSEEATASN